jgi:hypothetical protein
MGSDAWVRHLEREERAAARRRKELATAAKAQAAWQERQRAEHEASVYANQIEFLLSMHKDCGEVWDWARIARSAPPTPPRREDRLERAAREQMARMLPPPPEPTTYHEQQARMAAQTYRPSLTEKLLGTEKQRRAELDADIVAARQEDARIFTSAQAQHKTLLQCFYRDVEDAKRRDAEAFAAREAQHQFDLQQHAWEKTAARAVLAGDLEAYRTVLTHLAPFAELVDSGMNVSVTAVRLDVVVLRCLVDDDSIVPREEKKLNSSGKLVSKQLPAGTFWGIYQDYVCGCALRAAREVFAVLPVPRVVVNVARSVMDSSTGHQRGVDILAVSVPREVAASLNFAALDPSDSLANFPHRMKFKKSSGFDPIDAISADDVFVTTGARSR